MSKETDIVHELREIRNELNIIKQTQIKIMSNFTSLQSAAAALSAIATSIDAQTAAIVSALSSGGVTDASLAPISTSVAAAVATLTSDLAKINSVLGATGSPTVPVIVNQPQPPTIPSGGTETMTVTAVGSGLTFQWYQGTASDTTNPVAGATNASFTTPALTSTTSYWVRVSNTLGSVDSSTVIVTVLGSTGTAGAPVFTTQPITGTGSISQGTTQGPLSVAVTSATPVTFQWFTGTPGSTNPVPVAIPGATTASFLTPAQTVTGSISYFAAATNSVGTTNSTASIITAIA
jgi:hypothetical protein